MDARPARQAQLVAAGWFVVFLGYLLLFYATPLSSLPAERSLPRGAFLLAAFTPEFYWQTWTGDGALPTAVRDRLPVLVTAAFILGWGAALGWGMLTLAGLTSRLTRLETAVFSAGAGLNLLSLMTLVIGLAGGTSPTRWGTAALAAVSGGVVALAIRRARRNRYLAPHPPLSDETLPQPTTSPAWLALGAPIVLALVLGAMLPPRDFDVREYHLQVPKEWFLEGRITFLPHNVYGNMPLGAEMHALLAMALSPGERSWWWGALAGKTVMACFAPLTALALFAAGRRFFSPLAGVAAAVAYLSIPWIAHTAMAGLNDHVLACYVFLAFYALLLGHGQSGSTPAPPDSTTRRNRASSNLDAANHDDAHHAGSYWRLTALAGFLAGAAAACKYTGLVFAAVPLGLLAVGLSLRVRPRVRDAAESAEADETQPAGPNLPAPKSAGRRALMIGSVFALAALAGGGLWYGKNFVLTGNPVYPLLFDVFGGRTRTPELDDRWRRAHQVPRSEVSGPYSPARLAAAAAQVAWRSDWLSPLLVPLMLLAPLARRNRRVLMLTAGMAAVVLAGWWLLTHRIDRFWIPALPLAALAAGAGAAWSEDHFWRRLMLGVLTAGVAANFLVIASPVIGDNRFFVALEALRTDVGDPAQGRVGRVNPAHQYLNEHVPAGDAVLLVGDAQPFDLEPRTFYNTTFDPSVFAWFMKGRSAGERRATLRMRNVTHVYVDWRDIARYRSPGNYGFTDYVQPAVFDALVAQGVLRLVWSPPPDETDHQPSYPPPQIYKVLP